MKEEVIMVQNGNGRIPWKLFTAAVAVILSLIALAYSLTVAGVAQTDAAQNNRIASLEQTQSVQSANIININENIIRICNKLNISQCN